MSPASDEKPCSFCGGTHPADDVVGCRSALVAEVMRLHELEDAALGDLRDTLAKAEQVKLELDELKAALAKLRADLGLV